MVPGDAEKMLTSAELAERLNVSRSTIQRWRFDGIGPRATRLTPRTVRYARAEVERYEAERAS